MEAWGSSETSVNFYQVALHDVSEHNNVHSHCSDSLESRLHIRLDFFKVFKFGTQDNQEFGKLNDSHQFHGRKPLIPAWLWMKNLLWIKDEMMGRL